MAPSAARGVLAAAAAHALVLAAAAPWAGPGSKLNADGSGIEATVVYDRSAAGPVIGTNGVSIVPAVTKVVDGTGGTLGKGIPGYTTWNLTVQMLGNAKNAYTIYGSHDAPMVMPAAWKCNCDPFGSNIGGTNPAFWQYKQEAQWDSWLTIGITDGNAEGDISGVGINYTSWNTTEINTDNGAIFFMNPDNPKAPSGTAVVAQLTLKTGVDVYAAVSLQGRSKKGPDWNAESVLFSSDPQKECQEALQAICGADKAVSPQACLACCGHHELEAKAANCTPQSLGTFCKPTMH